MAEVTVALIKVLRDRTGAGLMDCKNALLNTDGDVDAAADWLREKGIVKAAKKAERIAAEGLALTACCDKCGRVAVVEVNCETDFVANGDAFRALVNNTAEIILKNAPATLDDAKELTKELFTDGTVKIGEKLDLRRFEVVDHEDGKYVKTYLYNNGKIAVLLVSSSSDEDLTKGLCMHITNLAPKYITMGEIPASEIEKETAFQMDQAKEDPNFAKKPEQIQQKIIGGKVNAHFADQVLEAQTYLLDPSKTVGQLLKEKNVTISKIIRYAVGEGIEKRVDDFAAEVMAQAK